MDARTIAPVEAAGETLREREEQYRRIFEATSDGVMVHDLDGRIVEANSAICRMHGYSRDEFVALHPLRLVRPDHHQQHVPAPQHLPPGMHAEPATPDSPPTPDCQLEPALLRAGPLLSSLAGVLLAVWPQPQLIAVAAAQAVVQPPRPLQRGDPQALLQVFRN